MPDPRIACLVLAAGGGSRLGGGKLLLPWRGKPLLAHVLEAATRATCLEPPLVVLGHRAADIRQAVEADGADFPKPIRFVENLHWEEGMGSSLRCGVAALLASPGADSLQAVLAMLGDQPQITPQTLDNLAQSHAAAVNRDPEHPATAPVHHGRRGNPVILSRPLFPEILAIRGDIGAREILASLGNRLLLVQVGDPGVLRDVDTPEEYGALSAP